MSTTTEPMTFRECVVFCARQSGLVQQWERLSGHSLTAVAKASPMEHMIDAASGHADAECAAFVAFVYDCVWTRGDWRTAPSEEDAALALWYEAYCAANPSPTTERT